MGRVDPVNGVEAALAAPLTTLLSWIWLALVIEADNAFETACAALARRPFRISFAMWANGLRCIDDAGTAVGELRAATGAACNLGGLERWGWVSVGPPSGKASRRPGYGTTRGITDLTELRPTRAGAFARRVWPQVLDQVERAWASRLSAALETLRAELVAAVDQDWPWAPPEVHPSDGFWTHVWGTEASRSSRRKGPTAPEPATASARAARPAPAGEQGMPLAALAGQVLTRCTVEHEAGSRVSLPLAANGLRLLADGPVRLRDVPARSGISKEAVAMVTGFLSRRGLAAVSPGRTISLTDSGVQALEDYRRRTQGADRGERVRQALAAVLAEPGALSAALDPPAGVWRSEPAYRAQTARRVADPAGTLPWHPMVLHRGGWPDGS